MSLRVAIYGLPGVGKSTAGRMLLDAWRRAGVTCARVPLADPLYSVQRAFYQRLGHQSVDGRQDGKLLNFLGSHFRAIDPEFILTDVERRVRIQEALGADVVICDDARPVDLDHLRRALGMRLVQVTAPEEMRRAHLGARGDLQLGAVDHPTELGAERHRPDVEIHNSGGLDELESACTSLTLELLAGASRQAPDLEWLIGELKAVASDLIRSRYVENRHQIAATIVDEHGRVFVGLHIEATIGKLSVCAEAAALASAILAGESKLMLVGALRHPKPTESGPARFVPPCGACRELLLDYAPSINVVLGDHEVRPMAELLPQKYVGTKWAP